MTYAAGIIELIPCSFSVAKKVDVYCKLTQDLSLRIGKKATGHWDTPYWLRLAFTSFKKKAQSLDATQICKMLCGSLRLEPAEPSWKQDTTLMHWWKSTLGLIGAIRPTGTAMLGQSLTHHGYRPTFSSKIYLSAEFSHTIGRVFQPGGWVWHPWRALKITDGANHFHLKMPSVMITCAV